MAFSKIIFNGTTQIDLTQDTVATDNLLTNYTAHGADGNQVIGTATGGGEPTLQTKSVSYSPSTSAQSATVTADTGYDGLSQVNVSISAMSLQAKTVTPTTSQQVITPDNSEDLVVGLSSISLASRTGSATATVNLSSLVSGNTYHVVGSGTFNNYNGTLSATEHVTIDTYIQYSSGMSIPYTSDNPNAVLYNENAIRITGTSVSVTYKSTGDYSGSLSTLSFYQDTGLQAYDGLSQVTVNAIPTGTAGTPTATKGTVSNHQVSVTPSVTNTTGYITGSTKTGTAVTVTASELVSGSETKTANGTYDVTNLASLVVAVPIVTYYTGTSNPSSSQGQNNDIYLKTVS